jgi:hypothetical protein
VFFPLGVFLQGLDTPVAVILQFYALYYVLGGLVAPLKTLWLGLLTTAWMLLGPVLFLALADPSLAGRGTATDLLNPGTVVTDLLLTGFYPLLTWAPPLLVGLLVGRADLRDNVTTTVLTLAGLLTAGVAYGGSALALSRLSAGEEALSSLFIAEGHTGSPLNVLGSTAVAVTVLGVCLLLARGVPRITWPLVAVGQMALTVYVGHLFVLASRPEWLESRDSLIGAYSRVGRFYLVVIVICVAWRSKFERGPLEALLALPFKVRAAASTTDQGTPAQQNSEQQTSHLPERNGMPWNEPPHSRPPTPSPSPHSRPAPRPSHSSTPISESSSGTPPPPS